MTEAKQLLKSTSSSSDGKTVNLAVLIPSTSELHVLPIAKETFLTKDASINVTSPQGGTFSVKVVRANGVNTAVEVREISSPQAIMPLMVAYPIVKAGALTEMAYYVSAHPALLSASFDITSAGESYVSTMLSKAADSLAAQGVHIPADIVDIAEHLCVVEHTDHRRFMSEAHNQLFPEILSLYALNQGDTFRYSVSTAGAGGMIQMIPRTYEGTRQKHPNVELQSDFVAGMRNHGNALQAMLLYMNDTWNQLAESSEVQDALRSGIATKPELLAAGYNSNPMRLPSYLKTGGDNWRTLIPAETQMYLAIYGEVDRNVKFGADQNPANEVSQDALTAATRSEGLLGWFSTALVNSTRLFSRILL
jgi:hypothetical protein